MAMLIFAAFFGARLLAIGKSVTADEPKWLRRSANFYEALATGDLAATYQREHPGVTVMWAGMAGYLARFPGYTAAARGSIDNGPAFTAFLRSQGHEPLDLMVAGRIVYVAVLALASALAFGYAARLLHWSVALTGFALVAFDPLHVGLSRLLHPDGLLSAFTLLAVLALLAYWTGGLHRRDLVAAGIATGLAWLSKSPALVLGPSAVLLAGAVWAWNRRKRQLSTANSQLSIGNGEGSGQQHAPTPTPQHPTVQSPDHPVTARTALLALLAWGAIALATFVLLWPAMWVDPVGTLAGIFSGARDYAVEGHSRSIFFQGQIVEGDPGLIFYPIACLWRTTLPVLAGLILAIPVAFGRRFPLDGSPARWTAAGLLLFSLLFLALLLPSAQKFDRYLLPIVAPLALIAAAGWIGAAAWLADHFRWRRAPAFAVTAIALTLVQGATLLSVMPYPLAFYSPLLGGASRAPEVLTVGIGEGLDAAAARLNKQPAVANLAIMTWYEDGPFSYYTPGSATGFEFEGGDLTRILRWLDTDYAVTYVNQWQRNQPTPAVTAYFAARTPEQTIAIEGIEYARVYDVRQAPPPAFLVDHPLHPVDWGSVIRLVHHDLPESPLHPGETVTATFYLENLAPIDRNLNVQVRIADAAGRQLYQGDGFPWGSLTSQWPPGEVWPDGHRFIVPADSTPGLYRVELRFYDPATLEILPASDADSGAPLGESALVDYLMVGDDPALAPPIATFADPIELVDAAVSRSDLPASAAPPGSFAPGATLRLHLTWQATGWVEDDYTAFVHLVGPDGQLAAQSDRAPIDGFVPTGRWRAGFAAEDAVELAIPADAAPGTYALKLGLYDPATGQRLAVAQVGAAAGDAVTVAEIEVGE